MMVPWSRGTVVGRDHDGAGLGWVDIEGDNIAPGAAVGQFAMLVRPGEPEGSLGRPYAYFRTRGPHQARFLTRERPASHPSLLAAADGAQVLLRGPLGRPFGGTNKRVWAVAGGVGVAAFGGLVAPQHIERGLRIFLGVRSSQEAHLVRALEQLQVAGGPHGPALPLALHVSSDDGFLGVHGTVVDALGQALARAKNVGEGLPDKLFACGPAGMLEAASALAQRYGVACEVSVNVALPCGVGTCGGCAHTGAGGRKLMACIDGPTYAAADVFGAG